MPIPRSARGRISAGPVAPTRVLIYPMPRLLHDILCQLLSDDPGVSVLRCPPGANSMAEAAAGDADLVIASEREAEPSGGVALLRMPRARALAVTHDGQPGVLYELRPHRR